MTIKTYHAELLKVCKCCKSLYDIGANRYRYQCKKYKCPISKAFDCVKTAKLRKQYLEIWEKAMDDAFYNLTNTRRKK